MTSRFCFQSRWNTGLPGFQPSASARRNDRGTERLLKEFANLGTLDAFGEVCTQQLVMASVPPEDLINAPSDRASGDQRIVDGSPETRLAAASRILQDSRRPQGSQSGTGYGYFPETQ
jgi:hypothetical protein